jgi:ubiquinone/menaquinone biosynthesis C-methylase UbiE
MQQGIAGHVLRVLRSSRFRLDRLSVPGHVDQVTMNTDHDQPECAEELVAFHRAFDGELSAIVTELGLRPGMRVLDVACGDGYFTRRLAERVGHEGHVTGIDVDSRWLQRAEKEVKRHGLEATTSFVAADLFNLPPSLADFDAAWCSQSFYSLPDPIPALRCIVQRVRPGGLIGVLENDSMHDLLLPWPIELELLLRDAEYRALVDAGPRPSRYYIGRRLPQVMAAAGLEQVRFRTQCIDRMSPLDAPLTEFLEAHLERMGERVRSHLEEQVWDRCDMLHDRDARRAWFSEPTFTMSWLNVLAVGHKP